MENKKEFVSKLGKLLAIAKPNLVKCEYLNKNGNEYVVVTASNGYEYIINVTSDSLAAIVLDVFGKMICK